VAPQGTCATCLSIPPRWIRLSVAICVRHGMGHQKTAASGPPFFVSRALRAGRRPAGSIRPAGNCGKGRQRDDWLESQYTTPGSLAAGSKRTAVPPCASAIIWAKRSSQNCGWPAAPSGAARIVACTDSRPLPRFADFTSGWITSGCPTYTANLCPIHCGRAASHSDDAPPFCTVIVKGCKRFFCEPDYQPQESRQTGLGGLSLVNTSSNEKENEGPSIVP
jgi:hypothetical protein